jgi:hypothetical protein
MAYYLYTLTAYNNTSVASNLITQGVTAIVEENFATNTATSNTSGITINSSGNPEDGEQPGYLVSGVGIALPQNPFYRVNQGAGAYAGSKGYFGLLIGDTEVSSVDTWSAIVGADDLEEDWDGVGKELTWHTPSLNDSVYTLIVPTDNVIYQTSPQRSGNVLVWHIPDGELGVYAQNANLPSNATSITAVDTDVKAGGKIWAMGFGLINTMGTNLPHLNIA